jgi:hypothetical protein
MYSLKHPNSYNNIDWDSTLYIVMMGFCIFSVKTDRQEGFHIDLDDYLMGLLQLASELVYLCYIFMCNKADTTNSF